MKKRVIVTLLLIILTLSGCQINTNTQVDESTTMINTQQTPFIFLNTLSVFQTSNMYTVVIGGNEKDKKIVEFSSDRECLSVQGLVLVKHGELNQYLGKTLIELESQYGKVHADVGSGFYIPSYITEDGYLLSFVVEDDIAVAVLKRDLLTGVITERLYQ